MEEKLIAEKAFVSELKVQLSNADSRRQTAEGQVKELKAEVKSA